MTPQSKRIKANIERTLSSLERKRGKHSLAKRRLLLEMKGVKIPQQSVQPIQKEVKTCGNIRCHQFHGRHFCSPAKQENSVTQRQAAKEGFAKADEKNPQRFLKRQSSFQDVPADYVPTEAASCQNSQTSGTPSMFV